MITDQVYNIREYHRFIFEEVAPNAPCFFFRYEDLRASPQHTLEKIFGFFLGVESVEGLNVQTRIREITSQGHQVSVAYAQKVAEDKKIWFNRSQDLFSDAQREEIVTGLSDFF